jgi:hypothetical protein
VQAWKTFYLRIMYEPPLSLQRQVVAAMTTVDTFLEYP